MRKMHSLYVFLLILGGIAISGWTISSALAMSVGSITKEELNRELGNSNLVILDVRAGKDWKSSEFKIKGATRANPREFSSWNGQFDKDKKVVLYCA